MNKGVIVVQSILIIFLLLTIFQIYFSSYYDVQLIIVSLLLSYVAAIYVTSLLSKNFFSWFMVNKRSIIVLVFGVAISMLVVTETFALIYMTVLMLNSPPTINSQLQAYYPASNPNSIIGQISTIYNFSYILTFVILWLGCALLLKYYWGRSGHMRYWLLISLPLIFFLSQFISFNLGLFTSIIKSNPALYIFIFNFVYALSLPIGGLLFAMSFWIIAKKKRFGSNIRQYMDIAGYGIFMIWVSGQVVVTQLLYPPFGIFNISFITTSLFLLFIGILSSAITASLDTKLLSTMKDSVGKNFPLFDSIADAQRRKDIFNTILRNTIKEKERVNSDEDGFKSSLSDEDLKNYLNEILEQASKHKSDIK